VKNIEVLQAKEAAEDAAGVKSQFISTISHEIRTPLNAIIGVTNLLHSGNPREEQIDNLNILKISSENLLQLVNNFSFGDLGANLQANTFFMFNFHYDTTT
jgi:signal transduction histidine kinase